MRDEKGHFIKGHKVLLGSEKGWFKKGQKPWCTGTKGIVKGYWTGKKRTDLINTNASKTMFKITNPRRINSQGYIEVYDPQYPHKCALEHRKVMEEYLGRKLKSKEQVHHINHNKTDNRIENLLIIGISEHARMHMLERIYAQ